MRSGLLLLPSPTLAPCEGLAPPPTAPLVHGQQSSARVRRSRKPRSASFGWFKPTGSVAKNENMSMYQRPPLADPEPVSVKEPTPRAREFAREELAALEVVYRVAV